MEFGGQSLGLRPKILSIRIGFNGIAYVKVDIFGLDKIYIIFIEIIKGLN